ncbi:MAG: hypothetical protein KKD28_06395, partial [Chloroflexi bacterium]|nr:hypothetical protein [Chloroflexota bacterium]
MNLLAFSIGTCSAELSGAAQALTLAGPGLPGAPLSRAPFPTISSNEESGVQRAFLIADLRHRVSLAPSAQICADGAPHQPHLDNRARSGYNKATTERKLSYRKVFLAPRLFPQ